MGTFNGEIFAYKVFYNGLVNRYGYQFETLKEYRVKGKIQWGNHGNGFHMCSYPEDCFRYFDRYDDIVLTRVRGFGDLYSVDDEYFGYYDMFVCEGMEILKIYTREEVLDMMLSLDGDRLKRFLITNGLSIAEVEMFRDVFKDNEEILNCISYYQEDNKDTFVKRRGKING
ncbi:MAG: hypothetical protein HFH46_01905 [Bacilli bacterium]|nr:hypothetical protein [Bacilli bacterium]